MLPAYHDGGHFDYELGDVAGLGLDGDVMRRLAAALHDVLEAVEHQVVQCRDVIGFDERHDVVLVERHQVVHVVIEHLVDDRVTLEVSERSYRHSQ